MKSKRILIAACLITSLSLMSGCTIELWPERPANSKNTTAVYASELNPQTHQLVTDQRFKSLDNDEPVRFETAVTAEEAQNGTPVNLCDNNGKSISKMYDDGTHSDRIAGDGIYTCSYKPKVSDEASFSYSAQIGDFWTDPASVRYFDKITEKDIEDSKTVYANFAKIMMEQYDGNDEMTAEQKDKVLDSIGDYAETLYNQGAAVEYRVNKNYGNVVMKLSSGITCVYSNPSEDTLGGGASAPTPVRPTSPIIRPDTTPATPTPTGTPASTPSYAVKSLKIKGYIPLTSDELNTFLGDNVDVISSLNSTISTITSTPDFQGSITSDGVQVGTGVGPHSVKEWGANQIIFWIGHGGYDGMIHSYLATNEAFDPDNFTSDDLINDRIIIQLQVDNSLKTEIYNETDQVVEALMHNQLDANGDGQCNSDDLTYAATRADYYGNQDGTATMDEFYILFLSDDHFFNMFIGNEQFMDVVYNACHPCITSEYIKAHCSNLTDTFIYINSCYGLQDSVLSASLLSKGCNVVVGYTNSVHDVYEQTVRERMIQDMCTPQNTNAGTPLDYLALDSEIVQFQATPDIFQPGESGNLTTFITKVDAFGNREYRFAEAIADDLDDAREQAQIKLGSLQLDSTYIRIDNGSFGTITVKSLPDTYTMNDLIWTVDNDQIATVGPNGEVYGISTGSTRVCVVTDDGLYSAACFVGVR